MSLDDFDFQFLEEGNLLDFENGIVGPDKISVDVDSMFSFGEPEIEKQNPVFGNDLSLASALNTDDDLLACNPTDTWQTLQQKTVDGNINIKAKTSPWHESDSGMSDSTYDDAGSGSPQSYTHQEDNSANFQQSNEISFLNVDDLVNVEDTEECGQQLSPVTVTSFSLRSSSARMQKRRNEIPTNYKSNIDSLEVEQKQALEFFKSSDIFSLPHNSQQSPEVEATGSGSKHCVDDRSRKNAVQAKMNREKKKVYIKSLEDEISTLKSDNTKLKSENTIMQSSMTAFEEEVDYLKSVLVNSSALSGLLKNISGVTEVKLSASIVGRKRSAGDDHSYNIVESVPEKRARRINDNLRKAGVCLHVNGPSACLEFCAHCSKLAKKSSAL